MHEHFMGDELPHTVRVGRNIPGWMGEQMGLRSGGHAVAIGLSIVGAVVVAYAGPERMFPTNMSAATLNTWPWLVLWTIMAALIVWELHAVSLRHQWRCASRELRFESVSRALRFANDTLALSGQGRHGSVWHDQAVAPLAALVYAASSRGNGEGMPWVRSMVARLADEGAEGWRAMAAAVAHVDDLLTARVTWWADADPRQRDSVALVLCEAVNGYAGAHA